MKISTTLSVVKTISGTVRTHTPSTCTSGGHPNEHGTQGCDQGHKLLLHTKNPCDHAAKPPVLELESDTNHTPFFFFFLGFIVWMMRSRLDTKESCTRREKCLRYTLWFSVAGQPTSKVGWPARQTTSLHTSGLLGTCERFTTASLMLWVWD